MTEETPIAKEKVYLAVLVAALGYFVDVYDIVLFSIVRVASLKSLGFEGEELLSKGVLLINMQMIGMLVGGILWGIWGDKRGRIQVLFGSILMYSLANLANAFVTNLEWYAVLRFIAGVGLAGEIGAGITLVSELMDKEKRGVGTTIVATVGVSGAVVAGLVGEVFDWRTAYIIGGSMGLALLLLRVSVCESGIFDKVKKSEIVKGDLRLLFRSRERMGRYISCILVGVPIWFVVGIIVTFCPEIGRALSMKELPSVSLAVFYCYVGLTVGDLASGLFSQIVKSRRKALFVFLSGVFLISMAILNLPGKDVKFYYGALIALGFFSGYWAVFVTTAAEQFGTNLRATVATSVPNFVRGSTVIMTLLFDGLKGYLGVVGSAQVVCLLACGCAFFALWRARETYGIDLNFVES